MTDRAALTGDVLQDSKQKLLVRAICTEGR